MKKMSLEFYFGSVLLFLFGCQQELNNAVSSDSIATARITAVSLTSAMSGGTITDNGTIEVIARGVCWSTSQAPTIADFKTNDGSGFGNFTSTLTGLKSNTTYYIRAYVTNSTGTSYGNELIFKTYTGIVTDVDGNSYFTVTIDKQIWMAENLQTTKYRNGDPIPNITDNLKWGNMTFGAYCIYDNDSNNKYIYGCLYNWYAVNDSRNIAPAGWHVATVTDWKVLIDFIGGGIVAGGKLKETGTAHWINPNQDATNETGFSALPGGNHYAGFSYNLIGYTGDWWSATSSHMPQISYTYTMYFNIGDIFESDNNKEAGLSVRCVKD